MLNTYTTLPLAVRTPLIMDSPRARLVMRARPVVRALLAMCAVCAAAALCGPAVAADAAKPVAKPAALTSTGFGFASFEASLTQALPSGSPPGTPEPPDTQAGSHPSAVTVTFELAKEVKGGILFPAGGEARNIEVNLPPGVIGNPSVVPQCTRPQFAGEACPAETRIGTISAELGGTGATLLELPDIPLYNLVPPAGIPAQFGFELEGIHTYLDAGVRTGGDNGVTVHGDNTPQRGVVFIRATVSGTVDGKAFLTLPTSCGGPLQFSAEADTWEEPQTLAASPLAATPALTGCERLSFRPSITLAPDTNVADSPAGLAVDVRVPQDEGLTNPERLVASNIEQARVTLPPGVAVNPGRASGLQACPLGPASTVPGEERFGDNLPLPGENGEAGTFDGPAICPAASKVGTVEIESPLIRNDSEPLFKGNVYVLQSNPPELKLLLAASADGVNLKLVGEVHMNEETGQLTTTFSKTPDLPFSDLRLSLEGGSRGALVTPATCGSYSTSTDFTPWAGPYVQDASSENTFSVQSGPEGTACGGGQPFGPSMVAGMTGGQAGGFGSFSVTLSRRDRDQELGGVAVQTPPGLLGLLKTVEQCGAPQASTGTCGPGSLIGQTSVALGPGPEPLWVRGGQVFLTGPYRGAPFGLSIVVPAVAGPFTLLGNAGPGREVVRAAIEIDPHTAQVTVVSDPLPRILDGVPLQLATVNVTIDREGFMFNPTNCEALTVAGTLTSTQGASTSLASGFHAVNCATLPFKPSFSASTAARASRLEGASLDVKITSKGGPQPGGGEANIGSVKVALPKQLPSRLTTLRRACTAGTFEANPGACPKESDVGTAIAVTPVLAHPLVGPAYLVSHGDEAYPDLEIVLQGEGITLILDGQTAIKRGVTSSTFNTVPDAPISSFELKLPTGKYSILGAYLPAKAKYDLCGQALTMPTTITGQNGAVVAQTTKIAVSGCPKHKTKRAKRTATRQGARRATKQTRRARTRAHRAVGDAAADGRERSASP